MSSNWQNNLLSGDIYSDASLPYYVPANGDVSLYNNVTDVVNTYTKKILGLNEWQKYAQAKDAELTGTELPEIWKDFEGSGIYEVNGVSYEHFELSRMLAYFLRFSVYEGREIQAKDFGGVRETGSVVERSSSKTESYFIIDKAYNSGVSDYFAKLQFLSLHSEDYLDLISERLTARNTYGL